MLLICHPFNPNSLHEYAVQTETFNIAFEAAAARIFALADAHVSRLMLELETAGNIRLEVGRPQVG